MESGTDFSFCLATGDLRKGERVKQKKGWVETGDVDRGKGKEEKGSCLLVFHFS